jgi:acyl dehydratase
LPEWWFDDFETGQVTQTMARTVTEADIVNFVTFAGIFEELFLNADYAREQGLFKGRNAPGFLALVFAEGLYTLTGKTHHGRALLGIDEVRLTAPVYAGDTIHAEITVLEARPSQSRPGLGVLTLGHSVLNQDDVQVMRYRTTRLLESRPTI